MPLLKFEHNGVSHELSVEELEALHRRPLEAISDLVPWCRHLEHFGVYFSGPLDFDLAMLARFPDIYKALASQPGPRIPEADSETWDAYISGAIHSVLGGDGSVSLYADPQWQDLFPWYRYLFLSRSKPATHLQALSSLGAERLSENSPAPVVRLLQRCEQAIGTGQMQE